MSNQFNHGLKRRQRFATPIDGNVGKESVLDFIPCTGSWRQMADGNREANLCGKPLQLHLPQPVAGSIGPASISHNQELFCARDPHDLCHITDWRSLADGQFQAFSWPISPPESLGEARDLSPTPENYPTLPGIHSSHSASHTCTVLSALPEAMRFPSGDHAKVHTRSECPR